MTGRLRVALLMCARSQLSRGSLPTLPWRERSSGVLSARWRRPAASLRSSGTKPHRLRPNCDVTAAPSGARHAGTRCWASCPGNSHLRRSPADGREPCAGPPTRRTAAALYVRGCSGPETQNPRPPSPHTHSGSEKASRPSSLLMNPVTDTRQPANSC